MIQKLQNQPMFSCWIIHWNSNVTVSVPVGIRQKKYSDRIQNCIMGSVSRNLTLLTYVETIQTAEKQNIVIQHLNFSKVNNRNFTKSFSRDFPNEIFRMNFSKIQLLKNHISKSNRWKSFYYFSHSLIFSNWRILHFWDT